MSRVPGSRGSALRGWAAAMLLAIALLAASCGGGDDAALPVLTIDEALGVEAGQTLRVQGHLVATESGMLLASALLESYPPQAGGSTVRLEGLDLTTIVGLSSTAGRPDTAQVTWSDYPLVLEGTIEGEVLTVEKTAPVAETETGAVRVRFSAVTDPLPSGEDLWWVFDVTNLTADPLDLTFSSGQMGEVVLSRDGEEVYRWSKGKSFTQAVSTHTVEPGIPLSVLLNDPPQLAPGDYEVAAKVTASAGPDGSPLPEISATIGVR